MFVRRAAVSDIPFIEESLRAICNYHYEGRPDLFRHDGVKYTAEELVGVLKDSIVLIAEDDGGQCGYLIAQPREYSADDNRNKYKSIYVDDIFVLPSSRHGGAGRLLMQAIFDEAKAMGCYNVTLNVWEFPGSAMKFYEALGMKPMAHTMELILDKKEKTQMTIGEFLINTKGEFESDLAELVAIDSVAGEPDGVYPYGKGSAAALDAMLSIAENTVSEPKTTIITAAACFTATAKKRWESSHISTLYPRRRTAGAPKARLCSQSAANALSAEARAMTRVPH